MAYQIPLLIASLAAAAGGTVMQSRAASKAESERQAMLDAESRRQSDITEKAKLTAADTLEQFTTDSIKDKEDKLVGKNLKSVTKKIEAIAPKSFSKGSAPKMIKAFQESKVGQGREEAMQFANALAQFSAQGQALGAANLRSSGNAQLIGQLNQQQQNSANLLNSELAGASARAFSPTGTLLTQLGQAGASSAISGGALSGGGDAASTTVLAGQSPLQPRFQTLQPSFFDQSIRQGTAIPGAGMFGMF